jgi:hypothetical protein
MTGTANQIEWAEQIKARVSAEFDRVSKALQAAASNEVERDRMRTRALIEILEDKRAEVMAKDQADYFIVEWQELRDQVRRLIAQDSRYQAIQARKNASSIATPMLTTEAMICTIPDEPDTDKRPA